MVSMQDMFFEAAEPVWTLKHEKDDSKKADNKNELPGIKKEAAQNAQKTDYSILLSIPYYYYSHYVPPAAKKEEFKATDKKETKVVVMKVPICCEECEEPIEAAPYRMKGVKSAECDTHSARVRGIAATVAPVPQTF